MVGGLITFPLRVGVRATQLWLRAAEETVAVVADVTGRLIETAVKRDGEVAEHDVGIQHAALSDEATVEAPSYEAGVRSRTEASEPPGPGIARQRRLTVQPDEIVSQEQEADPDREPEPVHVSEEPELVEEVAEPGAEDGAGASVHVEEPWDGYAQMKAQDVIDRLAGAAPAELAAIQLYESKRKSRTTVLEAVKRELRISTGSGSQR